jgi:hypothetical protein
MRELSINENYKLSKYLKFSKKVDIYVKKNASEKFKKELKNSEIVNDEFLDYEFKCDEMIIPPMINLPPVDLNLYITKLKDKSKVIEGADIDIKNILDQIINISESISNATNELYKKVNK